jgi:hypothetical protein
MAESFDPYRVWLGIPKEEQPPHHYRLLGIGQFESQAEVIQNAADRQMAHVRSAATGKRSEASQSLLNELAAAKLCLLDAKKKDAYDHQLRAAASELAAPPVEPPAEPPRAVQAPPTKASQPLGQPMAASAVAIGSAAETVPRAKMPRATGPRRSSSRVSSSNSRRKSGGISSATIIWGAVGAVATLGLLVTALSSGGSDVDVRNVRRKTGTKAVPTSNAPSSSRKAQSSSQRSGSRPAKRRRLPKTLIDEDDSPIDPSKLEAVPDEANPFFNTGAKQEPVFPDPKPPKKRKGRKKRDRQQAKNEKPTQQPASERQAIPDAGARREATRRISVASNFREANTAAKKVELAESLLRQGLASRDPVEQYVLFDSAREMAGTTEAYTTALDAVKELRRRFDVDDLAMIAGVLESTRISATRPKRIAALAKVAQATMTRAVKQDEYEIAQRVGAVALLSARRSGQSALAEELVERIKALHVMQKKFGSIEAIQQRLQDAPDDPKANEAVGRHLCFAKARWDEGLPLLAKSEDPELREIAAADLKSPTEPAKQVALADDWYKAAQLVTGSRRKTIQQRAAFWYTKAAGRLKGDERSRVKKLLELLTPAAK